MHICGSVPTIPATCLTPPNLNPQLDPTLILNLNMSPPLPLTLNRGLILNEATGRTIQIGKGTYVRLLHEGYSVDRAKGVMTPPPAARSSGGGGRAGRA